MRTQLVISPRPANRIFLSQVENAYGCLFPRICTGVENLKAGFVITMFNMFISTITPLRTGRKNKMRLVFNNVSFYFHFHIIFSRFLTFHAILFSLEIVTFFFLQEKK